MGTGPLPDAQALAETYTGGYYDDPWAVVQQYEAYRAYAAENPNAGSYAIASAIDAPRSRVRPWEDGAVPDPVRGVTVAENRGWLPLTFESEAFSPLNRLVAATIAGGSINEAWVPSWHVDTPANEAHLDDALHALGLQSRVERRDEQERATELVPRQNASILGRLLVTMGAPRGTKAEDGAVSLPGYLLAAPEDAQAEWITTYLRIRGTLWPDDTRPGAWLRVREQRPDDYLDALATVIRLVLPDDEDVTVTRTEKNINISRAAVDALFGDDREPWVSADPA